MSRARFRRAFRLATRRRADIERELLDEMRTHIDLRAAELEQLGMPSDGARREAERRFGSMTEATHQFQETAKRREARMRLREFVDTMAQNLRLVSRQLSRAPAFTLGVVLTLALGVGANATMVGVLDRLFFRLPSGVVAPEHIGRFEIEVGKPGNRHSQSSFGYGHYRDLRGALDGKATIAAYAFANDYPLGRGAAARSIRRNSSRRPTSTCSSRMPRSGEC